MAITIVATAGSASANSYVTEAEATAYLEGRLDASAYTGEGDVEKQKAALVSATRRLDQEAYAGTRTTETQALKWPRTGVTDDDGVLYDEDTIPVIIKNATCEMALAALKDAQTLGSNALDQFSALTVGSISLTMRDGRTYSNRLPDAVARLLRPVLESAGGMVRVERA